MSSWKTIQCLLQIIVTIHSCTNLSSPFYYSPFRNSHQMCRSDWVQRRKWRVERIPPAAAFKFTVFKFTLFNLLPHQRRFSFQLLAQVHREDHAIISQFKHRETDSLVLYNIIKQTQRKYHSCVTITIIMSQKVYTEIIDFILKLQLNSEFII